MNNNEQSLAASLTAFQISLEKMSKSLADTYKPSLSASQSVFQPALLEFQRSIAETISPYVNLSAQIQVQQDALTAPIQEIIKQWNDSVLLTFREPFLNSSLLQQLHITQQNLTLFSSAIESIAIHDKYVDIPEDLIPDDYSYTEVDSSITHASEEFLPSSINVKKLSIPDAISVIYNLITLFFTIMTFLQTQQSSIQQQQNHEELVRLEQQQISLQETANSIQEKENELLQLQIDATEKNTKYLIELLNQLQEVDEDFPVTPSPDESAPSDTDSSPQCAHSQSQIAESQNPTKADGSAHFDAESNKSE